jgi:hypothetical protein
MTIRELFDGILRTDLYEILIWSEWYFRPSRVSCKECVEERGVKGVLPDCVKCGIPNARLIQKTFGKKGEKNV